MKRIALLILLVFAAPTLASFDDVVVGQASNNKIIEVMLRDSSTGQGKTDLVHDSDGMSAYYIREVSLATPQQISLGHGTASSAYNSGDFAEVSKANMPGLYQLHIPNAALTTGANACTIVIKATGVITSSKRILITTGDVRDIQTVCNAALVANNLDHVANATGGVTLANGAHGGNAAVITLQTPITANTTQIGGQTAAGSGTGTITFTTGATVASTTGAVGSISGVTFPANFASLAITSGGAITVGTLPSIPENWITATGINASALNGKGDWLTSGGTLATVTNLTNLPSIPSNWITATGINSGALNGKGDWLLSTSYTAPDNSSITGIKTVTDHLATGIELDGAVYRWTTNALEQAPTGGGSGCSGSGGISKVLYIKTTTSVAIADVRVWVTTDSAGENRVAGPLYTDAFGKVTFLLDAGTYYRWAMKFGVTFTNPASFTVSP